MRELTAEERTERRLWGEAQTNRLGVLIHSGVTNRAEAQRVSVEVTYQEAGEPEHCGFWIVFVPEIEPVGDDDLDLANHPASLASDKVHEWVEEHHDYEYFSIDDTFPA